MITSVNLRLVFLIPVLWFTLQACENTREDLDAVKEFEGANIERASEVEILYSDSAVVRVKIMGPVMLNYLDRDNPRREFPDGVHVTFYGSGGREQNYLTAKYAIRFDNEDRVLLRDSVVLTGVDGEMLESEELIWLENSDRIFTDKQVRITTDDEVIIGQGFESNQDFSRWEVRRITGQFRLEDDF